MPHHRGSVLAGDISLFACHLQRKKAIATGKVSNGKKFMIDFSSVQKFEIIWIFHEVTIDLRKNSAVMQTSNSGKLIKNFINVKNGQ